MITSPAFSGKHYAVLGLARSGLATVEALLASGAKVTAWDSKEEARAKLKILPIADGEGDRAQRGGGVGQDLNTGKPLHRQPAADGPPPHPSGRENLVFADPLTIDLTGYESVIVSPGVPLNTHPIVGHAAQYGVPVIGDIELFAQAREALPPHEVVGITGTNGKSTTTALITHIIETAGVPTLMGGNIGLPIMGRDPLEKGGIYVLELSSYQIDLTFSLDCDVAVLTNITPDHLDRYDGFEGYVASKLRLFSMQDAEHFAVLGEPHIGERWLSPRIPNANLLLALDYSDRQANWPALQGPHNHQNAACAIATCEALGISEAAIEEGLRTYPGLPHRMQRVAEKKGVLFVNDSKATNATATAPALGAYPKIHWILGGLPKTDDLDDCAPYFDHVAAAYTIGQAGPMYARILAEAGKKVTESGTLDQAVKDAAAAARPGEVVMLSPACASFDQFSDYEARGDAFRRAVEGLSL
ncbi:UDP-N-acetylmuramoyl-L-alanine--D-glutamate ligase [Rhizorhabdus dicambivorans]|uniref:UDP-N-acetylmuramoylalanine--D-glutamate ligase n=1 Tax=Rhizorhabdus dicambivorans TaxID=1850238 RepID=A0A2A4G0B0_9SPHN|nr:UDP-N-acetylmuramoyl-L-alanine--D-glutamate ligase [Rhizorhabdus dicambivorans]ATE66618.1 UDP-N-acetylmuramoyl-L-alanine--D-glutamate ligase [Rhizorhabdus dicambivorans]PCE43898.1 UDP-N-acetylmuramoyl-L-alanine--D-glutamate ligase [Rhizorhabdus dicambivorans]